jgi:hypothetical protein
MMFVEGKKIFHSGGGRSYFITCRPQKMMFGQEDLIGTRVKIFSGKIDATFPHYKII